VSINSALNAGVLGLTANATSLAAISDNIANVNTVAYKRSQVNFSTMVTSQSAPGRYTAGGVQAVSHQMVAQQGTIQAASASTDMAISGDGFFVVAQKAQGLTGANPRLFTRAGSFAVDADGFLVNDAGLYLQGWTVDAAGAFEIEPSDLTAMQSINVKWLGALLAPTTTIALDANLDATTAASPGLAAYNAATRSMADYAATGSTATGTPPDFTLQMSVIDSQGASHKLAVSFLKTAVANQWAAEIYAVPETEVTAGAGLPAGQIASGVVEFNSDGSINLGAAGATTLFGAPGSPAKIALGASGSGSSPEWASGLGVAGQTIGLDLSQMSQIASASAVTSVSSDGASPGNVVSIQADADGSISAVFDNSQVRKIAQIGLATFTNPGGLQPVSANAYQASRAAGVMVAKPPGVGGAGKVAPSSLEASTVDLAAEFTGLITTQKAYSASSKIVTTADEMLTELISMKR
jgi:flagellar hook protein FlgE